MNKKAQEKKKQMKKAKAIKSKRKGYK